MVDPINGEENILNPRRFLFRKPRPASHTMSQNPPSGFSLSALLPSQRKRERESSQDRRASPPRPSGRPGGETEEKRGDAASSAEVKQFQREIRDLKSMLDRERADAEKLKEKWMGRCKRREDQIKELGHKIEAMRVSHRGDMAGKIKYIQAVEERLKETEGLLAARSEELSGTQTFLSTTDRLSEVEVLSIVRDLNENIYQVAVKLTEEWEKLESSKATGRMDVDPASKPDGPIIVQLVRNRDPMGLTLLLQSCLCYLVVGMTSSWGPHQELAELGSIYQRLSASGEHRFVNAGQHVTVLEGQAISARWRSLTHSYLSRPPVHSASLVGELANVFDITGSFPSTQQSLEFVQAIALEGIESIINHALRSELAFRVEVTSSDMTLLFEPPGTEFDKAKMSNDYGSNETQALRRRDRIAATTEVGVGKSICGGPDESRREEILLRVKVVLEKDVLEEVVVAGNL